MSNGLKKNSALKCILKNNNFQKRDSDKSENSYSTRVKFDRSCNNDKTTNTPSKELQKKEGYLETETENDTTTFLSKEAEMLLAPDMKIQDGDSKCTYQLADKGKLVKIIRRSGEIVYMLRCVDGRRVYIERTNAGACLIMTNQQGKIVKSLAGQY